MRRLQIFSVSALIVGGLTMQSFIAGDDIMTKEDDLFAINTTQLCKDVEGYAGPTPLKIYIRGNKVERIEFLKSQETPKYYAKVKKALAERWSGLRVKEASKQQVDAVTGATFSSEAVIKNVQSGLEYYLQHK